MDDAERTRVVYVTARLPYGATEPFIIAEVAELERQGCDVTLVPVRAKGAIVHADARELLSKSVSLPVLSARILAAALAEAVRAPAAAGRALASLRASRSPRVLLKNLVVFPKALWLARRARRLGAEHLHAHWAGTSGTVAMLASQVSGIPWSLTAHRWDITEDNLLRLKARRACFVRAISERGADELRRLVGDPAWSPWILHMGVRLPPRWRAAESVELPLRLLAAASFVEVKGQRHLLEAVRLLKHRRLPVRVELAGDGPLESSLRARVRTLGLEGEVVFLGRVPHEQLLDGMSVGRWHATVLPSVIVPSGIQEGIPVALIEALASGVPAVGTKSGGIPELLGEGAGLLVTPADPEALADAIEMLAGDPALRAQLAERGRRRVEESFSAERIAAALHARFRECRAPRST